MVLTRVTLRFALLLSRDACSFRYVDMKISLHGQVIPSLSLGKDRRGQNVLDRTTRLRTGR